MVAAAVGTPLLVMAAIALVVALTATKVAIGVGLAAVFGAGAAFEARRSEDRGFPVVRERLPEVHAAVDRLCALADIRRPDIVLERQRLPNSWITAPLRGRPRLHVTTGLLALLTPDELEAVVGHELAHLAHRDATVMTVVGGPSAALMEGARHVGGFALLGVPIAFAIGWLSSLGTNALSRYRELAADATSAALTGRPMALASALHKVSGRIRVFPTEDFREIAARDAFNLLPVGHPPRRLRALHATHPSLDRRIAQLERLERAMHAAGRALPPE